MIILKVKVANSSSKKTRAAIRSAFAQLTKEKRSINNITITELVKRAGITRSSFYTHYDNLFDVAKELQDEFLDVIFNDDFQITSLESMTEYLKMVIEHLKSNEELYKMLLSSDDPLLFMNRLNKMMTKHLESYFSNRLDENIKLKISFFVSGVISLFIRYFKDEIDTSLEELTSLVITIFNKLFF